MLGTEEAGFPITLNSLAREIVAFANTFGGALVLGINETKDKPSRADSSNPIPRIHELEPIGNALIARARRDLRLHERTLNFQRALPVLTIRVTRLTEWPQETIRRKPNFVDRRFRYLFS
jgi:predicted HTH transcriptional regulator